MISASLTGSLSPGDQSLAQVADIEHGRGFNIVPVLLGERIDAGKERRHNSSLTRDFHSILNLNALRLRTKTADVEEFFTFS